VTALVTKLVAMSPKGLLEFEPAADYVVDLKISSNPLYILSDDFSTLWLLVCEDSIFIV